LVDLFEHGEVVADGPVPDELAVLDTETCNCASSRITMRPLSALA